MPGAPSANEQTTRRGLSNQGMGRIPVEMRHLRIMEAFQQNGFISVTEMAAKIGVSTMTIPVSSWERTSSATVTRGMRWMARA